MSETATPWRSFVSFVILQQGAARLLLLPAVDGWSLPQIALEQRLWVPQVAGVLAALRDELGIAALVVRCAENRVDREARTVHAIYLAELRRPDEPLPTGSRWVDPAELAELLLAQPEQRALLLACLAELDGAPTPPERPPWAYPGWHAPALAWIEAHLARLGYTLLAPIEQIKSWCLSCILRAQTDAGAIYFKVAARLPLFADEPAVVAALAARYPALVPAPLAIERERGWLLLADLGGELRDQTELALWTDALSAYGQMQRHTAADIDALLASGCVDRSLARLATQIDPLLESEPLRDTLSADELARLRDLAPLLKARCAELERYGLPTTLVHGDLHGGNVALSAGRYTIFDWTDACIGHPFIDLSTMLLDISELLPDPAVQAQLRDSYLAQWTAYASLEQLQHAWALTAPLAALHHAVSYQSISASVEPAEREIVGLGAVSYWLRQVLELLDAAA